MKKTTVLLGAWLFVAPSFAQMNENLVKNYASAMQSAANARNLGQIASLLADDVMVSLTRQGKGSTTLDKAGYLNLLQKSWSETDNYRYSININNIVVTGDTARAQFLTKESFVKDGKPTTLTTNAKATLGVGAGNALLLRSVAQVTVE